MKNFHAAIGIVTVVVIGTIIRGFVISKCWQWFIVPFGIVEIGIAHAIGLSVIVSTVTYSGKSEKKDSLGDLFFDAFLQCVVSNAFYLCVAYIVKSFM